MSGDQKTSLLARHVGADRLEVVVVGKRQIRLRILEHERDVSDETTLDLVVPPQLWNKTARKTTAKANEIRASGRQLRLYGMVV